MRNEEEGSNHDMHSQSPESSGFRAGSSTPKLIGSEVTVVEAALLASCQRRDTTEIISLLKDGANPEAVINCIQNGGKITTQTPIGSVLLGEYLDRIAKPDKIKEHRNRTFQVLNILLQAGANPNAGQFTTLNLIDHIDGCDDILPFLVSHGMKIKNNNDFYSLLEALMHGDIEQIETLRHNGIDMNQRNIEGNCAIHQAFHLKSPLPVDVIAPAGDKRSQQWCKYLLALKNAGIDLNLKDRFGMTLLQTALASDQADLAIGLIYAGLDPNEDTTSDQSPIFLAAVQGDLDTVRRIIAAGASYDQLVEIPQRLMDKDTYTFAQSLLIGGKAESSILLN